MIAVRRSDPDDDRPVAEPAAQLEQLLAAQRWTEAEALARRLLARGARDAESHASAVIAMARAALGRGDSAAMRRWLDRAGRIITNDHRFREFRASLLLSAGDTAGALAALDDRPNDAPPDSLAESLARALALWQSGRRAEADVQVEELLHRHLITPDCALADLACMIAAATGRPGWVGHGGSGLLHGALRPDLPAAAKLVVRSAGDSAPLAAASVAEILRRSGGDRSPTGLAPFSLPLGQAAEADHPSRRRLTAAPQDEASRRRLTAAPQDEASRRRLTAAPQDEAGHERPRPEERSVGARPEGRLSIEVDGHPLLGSGLPLSQSPVIEGIVEIDGSRVAGWACCPDLPDFPLDLRLVDADDRWISLPLSARTEQGEQRWHFSFDLTEGNLAPGLMQVVGGPQLRPLAGSPVLWEGRRPKSERKAGRPIVDVVVPVYGGREHTLACLDSLLATLPDTGADLVVVDDATPDRLLAAELDRLAERGRITLLRNPANRGFPAAVNRGMALHPDRDVVLLNSDTLVFGDWLERLRTAAYASPETGTVTPLSNDATICTYPTPEPPRRGKIKPPPPAAVCAARDGDARRVNAGCRVELPTAVGFCMYIRRDCLAEVGDFSEDRFGRGYGEENDFCMRARRLGWRHYAAADVYVAHVGGQSFGQQRLLLQERNGRVLERLHPGYHALISRFLAADPLAEARRRLDLARWRGTDRRPATLPATLIITLDLDGGVSTHVDERMRALRGAGRQVFTLVPAGGDKASARNRCRLIDPERPEFRDLVFDMPEALDDLLVLLRRLPIAEVEIHHSLNHDPSVLTLAERLGVPYDVVVHDYHWICPQIVLIGTSGRYCGEPEIDVCERCALALGAEDGSDVGVAERRRRAGRFLAAARRVVVPCRDVATRLRRYFPSLAPVVEPWDRTAAPEPGDSGLRTGIDADAPLKVCVIGAIGPHKGYDVLLACARDAAARDLPLEFVIVGYSCDDGPLFGTGRVFVTGRYDEDEAVDMVRAQKAGLAFLPSVCPETWCYALSLAWRSGLRVAAFDLGAQAERISAAGGGWLLPLGMGPAQLNDTLLAIGRQSMVDTNSHTLPTGRTKDRVMMPASASVSAQISATTQALTLPAGFYAVTVKRGGVPAQPGRFPLPSVQLVIPPDGNSPAAVEILSSQPGNWLTKASDTLLIKISAEASVLLTSYKNAAMAGDSLEIEVTRIDATASPAAAGAGISPVAVPKADVVAHIQMEGDQTFPGGSWVGGRGTNRWVEAFGVVPVHGLAAEDIEYKGLTATGVETPWTSGGTLCGTRGQGTPLLGFAARLRGNAAERFDCLYEAVFIGGSRSALCRNGAPCRSDVLGAPLEGFLLSFVPKS